MAAELNAKIDELSDLRQAVRLMRELGVDTQGLSHLDDAKKRLRLHANKQHGAVGRATQPNKNMIEELMQTDRRRKAKLIDIYSTVAAFLNRLPNSVREDLVKAFPDLREVMKSIHNSLIHEKCAILIAGETSAGKSTLLNLLLGQTKQNLLPVAHLSVTSVICELKYGERPHAVAHPWPDDPDGRQVIIPLADKNPDILSSYIHHKGDRDQRFPNQRVEIFWPSEWLRAGVTIVDSPGVGENDEMTNLVKEYMKKAFGFIYVINCQNAGGIQHDRLEDLLLSITASAKRGRDDGDRTTWQLDPRAAIFVVNRWDGVKMSQRDEVKEYIFSKLDAAWAGLSQSQVFFLSAKQASESMDVGVISEDYATLLNGVEKLLPIGLNQRIEKYFSYVSAVMQKTTSVMRTYMNHLEANDPGREVAYQLAMVRLRVIETHPQIILDDLQEKVNEEIKGVLSQAKQHLMSPGVIDDLCHWEESQCPDANTFENVVDRMHDCAMKRIRKAMNKWDKENDIFRGIKIRLMGSLKKKFLSLEAELARIEKMMAFANLLNMLVDGNEDNDDEDATKEDDDDDEDVVRMAMSADMPLGMVLGLVALQEVKKKIQNRKLQEYRENKAKEMGVMTKLLLKHILESGKLQPVLEEAIEETIKLVRQMVARIPHMIAADKQIIEKLKSPGSNRNSDLLRNLEGLHGEAFALQGQVDLMYLVHIKSYDIDLDELGDWKATDQPVAQGAFAKVYKATLMKPGDEPIQCALKLFKDGDTGKLLPLAESNASDARLEETDLRVLQNRHVVKYFGTALMSSGPRHYMLMVMEFCDCSLKSYIEDRESYMPPGEYQGSSQGKLLTSMIHATDLARQMADGIRGIHAEGFVHRDLKPANILMTNDRQIRLADLGLTKSERKITGTVAGTLLYMAPEVLGRGRYGQPADMFAYGLILWELWYGRNVSEVYQLRNLRSLPSDAFKKERRPEASGPWCKTMTECWSEKPDDRPDAKVCRQRFTTSMNALNKQMGR